MRGPGGELALAAPRQVLLGADGLGAPRGADLAAISGWRRGVLEFNDVPPLAQVVTRPLPRGPHPADGRPAGRQPGTGPFPLDQLADAALLIRDVYGARRCCRAASCC